MHPPSTPTAGQPLIVDPTVTPATGVRGAAHARYGHGTFAFLIEPATPGHRLAVPWPAVVLVGAVAFALGLVVGVAAMLGTRQPEAPPAPQPSHTITAATNA